MSQGRQQLFDLDQGQVVLDDGALGILADVLAKSLSLWEAANPADWWNERKTSKLWTCCGLWEYNGRR